MGNVTGGTKASGLDTVGRKSKEILCRVMIFFLICGVLTLAGCGSSSSGSDGSDGDGDTETYTISGTVSGSVAGGVTITLSGDSTSSATTDSDGAYSFTVEAGSYTVTPSLSGYDFSPGSTSVTISDGDSAGIDFVSTEVETYVLSGTISGSITGGVTITLSGDSTSSATTDSDGAYSFTVEAGSYTVTPSLNGYDFSPGSTSVTISDGDTTGVDFVSTEAETYILSGTVSGVISEGVTIGLSGDTTLSVTTGASGDYVFTVPTGSYTVTPSLSGYSFTPESTSVTVTDGNVSDVDFTSAITSIGDRTDYDSVTLTSGGTYSSDTSGVENENYEYTSTTADTPAVKVSSGGSLTLTHSKATKSGETSSRENSGFYGFNSGVLASSSSQTSSYSGTGTAATITMTDCTITTDASGANGAFAFGEDAVVNLDYVTIITTGSDNSRGVDATYGGTVNISNSIISTTGGSCAALATDRYDNHDAPTINAENCEGTTAGSGSPGIYCTGTFNVTDCTLTATGSEAVVIEGLNSVTLENTDVSGTEKWGVMIYQSMSGDSSIGTGTFTMTGGTLTNNFTEGPMFFVCNTDAIIELDGATLVNSSDTFLVAGTAAAAGNVIDNVNSDWGTGGGEVTFTAVNQTFSGEIILCDGSSSIDLALVSSSYSGAINSDDNGTADLAIDAGSTWEATGTSYLDSLTNNGTISGTGQVYVDGTQVY